MIDLNKDYEEEQGLQEVVEQEEIEELNANKLNHSEEVQKLNQFVNEAQSFYSNQNQQTIDNIRFVSGGVDQWDEKEYNDRINNGRPIVTKNITKSYIDFIVNPLRINGLSFNVNLENEELEAFVNGFIAGIALDSHASSVYTTALTQAVSGGYSYVKLDVEKKRSRGTKKEYFCLEIKGVADPTEILMDPKSVYGDEPKYAIHMGVMDQKKAIEKYGSDATGHIANSQYLSSETIANTATVSDIVFYEIVEVKGEEYCDIKRFVGRKVVEHIRLPIDDIPIRRIVGEYAYTSNDIYYQGIVDRIKDTQQNMNIVASNTQEMVKSAPIQPLMIAEGQVEGYTSLYQQLNKRRLAYLPYKPMSLGGSQVPPPFRLDNSAQTQGLQGLMAQEAGDFSLLTAVNPVMMGQGGENQSGEAISNRTASAEVGTAHYIDNLINPLSELWEIALELAPSVYVENQPVKLVDRAGRVSVKMLNVSEILTPEVLDFLCIEIKGTPSMENRRREAIGSMTQLMSMRPELAETLLPEYIAMLDLPNGDKLLKAINGDGEQDPQAMEAMQVADQHINELEQNNQYLMGVVAQLQDALMSTENKYNAEIYKAELSANTELDLAEMNNAVKLEIERMKLGVADGQALEAQLLSQIGDAEAQMQEGYTSVQAIDEMQQMEAPKLPLSVLDGVQPSEMQQEPQNM